MSTHPIDIIANAIDDSCATHLDDVARHAAKALTDERIVDRAANALFELGWVPNVDEDAKSIARVVLRSVGGA